MSHRTALHRCASRSRRALFALCMALGLTFFASTLRPPSAEAAFPGRNGAIVFVRAKVEQVPQLRPNLGGGYDFDLFSVSPSGVVTELSNGPEEDWAPAWSPNGDRLAFSRGVLLVGSDIYVMDIASGAITSITDTPQDIERDPSWSPDGKKLAFTGDPGSPLAFQPGLHSDIYVMDSTGGQVVQLTHEDGNQADPQWSPRGRVIAYIDIDRDEIRLIGASGGPSTLLVPASAQQGEPTSLSWSPDGRRLAYTTKRGGDVWAINRDGSGRKRLTDGSSMEAAACWSPDGKWIAFMSDRDGTWKLYKMRPDGADVTLVVDIDVEGDPATTCDWGPRP